MGYELRSGGERGEVMVSARIWCFPLYPRAVEVLLFLRVVTAVFEC